MSVFGTLKKQRQLIHKTVSELSREELLTIPSFRKNNIAWNLAHIITVQQGLTYALTGNPMNIPEEYRAWYFRDTSPADWTSEPDVPRLLEELLSLPEQTESDYVSGRLANFTPYTTTTGVSLETIEDALGFNNFHEGIHYGIILSIRKEIAWENGRGK